jgi:hypothetical protein
MPLAVALSLVAVCAATDVGVDAYGGQDAAPAFAVPAGAVATTFARAVDEFAELRPSLLGSALPVLQLDAFASDDEVDALLAAGEAAGYTASEMQAGSSRQLWRTSSSTVIGAPAALAAGRSPVLAALFERAANVTQVGLAHFEPTQLVRYEPGQYYKLHLDHFDELAAEPAGPRVFTLLLYLNDVPDDAGGETVFKYAREDGRMLFVRPRKGRALLWPNTLDSDPTVREQKAMHAGGPLRSGVKVSPPKTERRRARAVPACARARSPSSYPATVASFSRARAAPNLPSTP